MLWSLPGKSISIGSAKSVPKDPEETWRLPGFAFEILTAQYSRTCNPLGQSAYVSAYVSSANMTPDSDSDYSDLTTTVGPTKTKPFSLSLAQISVVQQIVWGHLSNLRVSIISGGPATW